MCFTAPITKHIKNLESIIGSNLIVKNPKGIELTDKGIKLYSEIKEPIERLLSIENNDNEKTRNHVIRISSGLSITKEFLLDAMADLNVEYPNLRFSLNLFYYKDSIQRLRDGKLDIIFLNLRNNYNFGNDLLVTDFSELNDIFVVNKEIAKKFPKKIKLIDLNYYPIISKHGISSSRNFIEHYFIDNSKEFHSRYNVSNHWLIEKYVIKGLGLGLVTKEFVKEKLQTGEFVEIKTDINLPKRKNVYVTRKNSRYNEILNKFISKINENIK